MDETDAMRKTHQQFPVGVIYQNQDARPPRQTRQTSQIELHVLPLLRRAAC